MLQLNLGRSDWTAIPTARFGNRWIRSGLAKAILLLMMLPLTACLSAKSYVDPALPQTTVADLPKNNNPKPVQLLFEFQTRGAVNAAATDRVRSRVVEILTMSKQFSNIYVSPDTNERKLFITINNVALTDDAAAKGFGVGLTFGLVGTMVTDGYVMDASFQLPGKAAINKTYKHAIHTTIGNASGPPGLQAYSTQEAFNKVVDQLVATLLLDLSKDKAL